VLAVVRSTSAAAMLVVLSVVPNDLLDGDLLRVGIRVPLLLGIVDAVVAPGTGLADQN
jgi:hypothetical protein